MKTVLICVFGMFVVMKLNTNNNNNVGQHPNVNHGIEQHNGSNNDNVLVYVVHY